MLSDTEWGELDFLLIDLPPGTDRLPNMVDLLPRLSGTIIVTIPSGVSQFVVSKSINAATEVLKTPVIGMIENMSTHICSHCGKEEELFPRGGGEQMASEFDIPFLGKIPFDPRLAVAADEGILFVEEHSDSPAGQEIENIADEVMMFVNKGRYEL